MVLINHSSSLSIRTVTIWFIFLIQLHFQLLKPHFEMSEKPTEQLASTVVLNYMSKKDLHK